MFAAPVPEVDPKDIEVLKLDIVREYWNEYELEDRTILRGRLILTKAMRPKHGPVGPIGFGMQTFFVVTALPEKRGKRMQPPSPEQYDTIPKEPVDIVRTSEPWNIYRIEETGGLIQAKLVVTAVFHLKDIYDQEGEPFYIVAHGPVLAPGTKGGVLLGPEKQHGKAESEGSTEV